MWLNINGASNRWLQRLKIAPLCNPIIDTDHTIVSTGRNFVSCMQAKRKAVIDLMLGENIKNYG